ncbi:MAG: dihydropyrimidine dehydrogenase, partial [Mesorhizobium sp.]
MPEGQFKEGIAGGRLQADQYADNFSDLHPPLDHHEALVESDRCYFCYDAPCMNACPTSIDIPLFIRQISTGNPIGDVTILEARSKAGGLNEYGIAAYKSVDNFAQAEVDYVTAIGGIDIQNGKALGRDYQLFDLIRNYDAVFLGMGLGGVNALRADGEDAAGVINAVEFIAELRQASDLSGLP